MEKELKDIEVLDAKITLKRLRGRKKSNGVTSYTDKLFLVCIDNHICRVSTAFSCTEKGKKDLIKFIKRECYL